MAASTLKEVVNEWNNIYYHHKKTHKGDTTKFYNEILDKLAEKYYRAFSYENKLDFKRDVRIAKSNLKKSKSKTKRVENKIIEKKDDYKVIQKNETQKTEDVIDEGSGLIFTLKQIDDLDLLEETYL